MMSMITNYCLISNEPGDLEGGEYKSEMCWIQSDLHVCGKWYAGTVGLWPSGEKCVDTVFHLLTSGQYS